MNKEQNKESESKDDSPREEEVVEQGNEGPEKMPQEPSPKDISQIQADDQKPTESDAPVQSSDQEIKQSFEDNKQKAESDEIKDNSEFGWHHAKPEDTEAFVQSLVDGGKKTRHSKASRIRIGDESISITTAFRFVEEKRDFYGGTAVMYLDANSELQKGCLMFVYYSRVLTCNSRYGMVLCSKSPEVRYEILNLHNPKECWTILPVEKCSQSFWDPISNQSIQSEVLDCIKAKHSDRVNEFTEIPANTSSSGHRRSSRGSKARESKSREPKSRGSKSRGSKSPLQENLKPFPCKHSTCGKSYMAARTADAHMRAKHPTVALIPYASKRHLSPSSDDSDNSDDTCTRTVTKKPRKKYKRRTVPAEHVDRDGTVVGLQTRVADLQKEAHTAALEQKLKYTELALADARSTRQQTSGPSVLSVMQQMQEFQSSVASPILDALKHVSVGHASRAIVNDSKQKPMPRDWNVQDVCTFLREKVALTPEIIQQFESQLVTGLDLIHLSVAEMVEQFGVPAFKAHSLKKRLEMIAN